MESHGTVRSSSNGQRKSIEIITIRRPRCARSSSHFIDASGWFDLHRTDDDRASAGLISDDQDHHLPDRDRMALMFCGRIPRSQCDHTAIVMRSWAKSTAFVALSSRNHLHEHQAGSSGESRSRLWPDHGPIVGLFDAEIKSHLP